jgi:hypothetical protein
MSDANGKGESRLDRVELTSASRIWLAASGSSCGVPGKAEVVRFEARVLGAMLLAVGGLVAAAMIYEFRHPCLRYSSHRVFVEEFTT